MYIILIHSLIRAIIETSLQRTHGLMIWNHIHADFMSSLLKSNKDMCYFHGNDADKIR